MKSGKSVVKGKHTPTLPKTAAAIGMRTPKVKASSKSSPGMTKASMTPKKKAANFPVVKSNATSRTNASRPGVAAGYSQVIRAPKRIPFGTK